MSSKWNCNLKSSDCNVKEKNTNVTVGKLMGAAQQAGIYSVTTNNCYHMAGRVWISSWFKNSINNIILLKFLVLEFIIINLRNHGLNRSIRI